MASPLSSSPFFSYTFKPSLNFLSNSAKQTLINTHFAFPAIHAKHAKNGADSGSFKIYCSSSHDSAQVGFELFSFLLWWYWLMGFHNLTVLVVYAHQLANCSPWWLCTLMDMVSSFRQILRNGLIWERNHLKRACWVSWRNRDDPACSYDIVDEVFEEMCGLKKSCLTGCG